MGFLYPCKYESPGRYPRGMVGVYKQVTGMFRPRTIIDKVTFSTGRRESFAEEYEERESWTGNSMYGGTTFYDG